MTKEAGSRGEQISAEKDAGFCDRGHHFAEHKADPDDYVHGNCGILSVLDSYLGGG